MPSRDSSIDCPTTFVRVGELRLAVREWGSGEPLLMLHGLGMSSTLWRAQVAALSPRYRMIAPDLRGFGQSDRPDAPGSYDLARYVSDIAGLADALGVRRAHCLGASMGGCIAQGLAVARPDLCASLVLTNTSQRIRIPEDVLASRLKALESIPMIEYGRLVASQAIAASAPAELKAWVIEQIGLNDRHAYTQVLAEGFKTFDTSAVIGRIAVPTLVVVGSEDRVLPPEQGAALAASIAGAQLETVPDTGHLSYAERPEIFNRLVLEFLASAPLAGH